MSGHEKVVSVLLEANANMESKDKVSGIVCVYVPQVVLVFKDDLLLCFWELFIIQEVFNVWELVIIHDVFYSHSFPLFSFSFFLFFFFFFFFFLVWLYSPPLCFHEW